MESYQTSDYIGIGETHVVSWGARPRQAMHIMTPPISVRPPATQPTNRAEPKVYLSGERMAVHVIDSTLQVPPTAFGHACPLCFPFGFYTCPCSCPLAHMCLWVTAN